MRLVLKYRAMNTTIFMQEMLKLLFEFIKKQGFGVASITAIALWFGYNSIKQEAKMDAKYEKMETTFSIKIKGVEDMLNECESEREKLAINLAALEERFNMRFRSKK